MPRLVKQYPELRDQLWRGYFHTREDALFLLGALGAFAAVSRRQTLPLVLLLPWIWDQRSMVGRDIRRPARWWRIPAKYSLTAVRYSVQTLALIVSSARYRTPVL
jgi:hypothetical protein